MTADKTITLDRIRAEIDRIDDAILGLLAERLAVVEKVRAAKAGEAVPQATAMRPGREAEIIRRLLATRAPGVSAGLVERVWREIIAEATRVQVPLAVHACTAGPAAVAPGLIHGRFGTGTPVHWCASAAEAVRAVAALGPDVAVVGPGADGDDWVGALREAGSGRPRVVSSLPFVGGGAIPQALIVGHAPVEATGDDTTVIAVLPVDASGPAPRLVAGGHDLPVIGMSGRWRLVGAEGFHSTRSPLFDDLRADAAIADVDVIGVFANPVALPDSPTSDQA